MFLFSYYMTCAALHNLSSCGFWFMPFSAFIFSPRHRRRCRQKTPPRPRSHRKSTPDVWMWYAAIRYYYYTDRRRHRRKWHMCVHQAPAYSNDNSKKPLKRATSKRCRLGLRKTKPLKKLIKFLLNLCATAERSYTGGIAATNCEKRERESEIETSSRRRVNRNGTKKEIVNHIFPTSHTLTRAHIASPPFRLRQIVWNVLRLFFPSRSRLTQSNQILLSFVSWRQISSHSNRAPGLFPRQPIYFFVVVFFFLIRSLSFFAPWCLRVVWRATDAACNTVFLVLLRIIICSSLSRVRNVVIVTTLRAAAYHLGPGRKRCSSPSSTFYY